VGDAFPGFDDDDESWDIENFLRPRH